MRTNPALEALRRNVTGAIEACHPRGIGQGRVRRDNAMNCLDGRGERHNDEATHFLIDPDGKVQGRMCMQHAFECVNEYREKLAEAWMARPIQAWES
jgi:hypothetical protein